MAFISFVLRGLSIQFTTYLQSMSANRIATTLSILRGIVFPILAVVSLGFLFGVTGIWASMIVSELIGTILGFIVVQRSDPVELEIAFEEDVEL